MFTTLILYVYQRLISIHPFYMMIIIYKFHVIQYKGNNLFREDQPLMIKRGGIYIYYKVSLLLKNKNIYYLQVFLKWNSAGNENISFSYTKIIISNMKMKCFHYPQSFTLIIEMKLNFQCYLQNKPM